MLNHALRGTQKGRAWGAQLSSWLTGTGFVLAFARLFYSPPSASCTGFFITRLSQLIVPVILFISWVVQTFSVRYMWGDRNFSLFFTRLSAITAGLCCLICADHIALFLISLGMSYALLIKLIIHKPVWKASQQSGCIALRYLRCSFFLIVLAVCLLAYETQSFYLSGMLEHRDRISAFGLSCALLSLFLGALILSAACPFHKWLISSLNAPTPVSALMHAGLINGGGLLLIRFAPLYEGRTVWMGLLLVCGLLTMTIGTCWTLIQSDIKRLLACSTLAQMGFMLMQIGLGLFPAAIAHLCWHGMFKSCLFLRSGSSVQKKVLRDDSQAIPPVAYLLALVYALVGGLGFMFFFSSPIELTNASLFMASIIGVTTAQFAFEITVRTSLFLFLCQGTAISFLMGALYAKSVGLVERLLFPDVAMAPTQVPALFWSALVALVIPWLAMRCGLIDCVKQKKWWKRFYIVMLNASWPDRQTITTNKIDYQY